MDPSVAAEGRRPALRIRVEPTDPRDTGPGLGGRLELGDDGSRTAFALLAAEFAVGDCLTVGQALRTGERALHLPGDDDQEEEASEAAQNFPCEPGHDSSLQTPPTTAPTIRPSQPGTATKAPA